MATLKSLLMDEINKETIADLIKLYNINCIVETGTNIGDTTEQLAINYPNIEIHTLEINKEFYLGSSNRLSKYTNVHCHLGSSDIVLKELLPTMLNKKILFYLDAHWYDYWPLKNVVTKPSWSIVILKPFLPILTLPINYILNLCFGSIFGKLLNTKNLKV